jgi:two-component system, cell cycle sensor histidine kinase and response regulator CckA
MTHPPHPVDLPDLLDRLREVVIVFGRDGRVLHVNPSAERAYRRPAAELVGRTQSEITGAAPDTRSPFRDALESVLAGGHETSLITSIHGGSRWFDISIYPHRLGAFATARDVTEMHQALIDVAKSEERFRAMVEFSPEAIVILDTSTGRFCDLNPAAERLFGRTRDELLALTPTDLMPREQRDGTSSEARVRDAVERTVGGERVVGEYEALGPRGDRLTLELHSSLLPSTNPVLVRGSLFDVTARSTAQQHLAEVQRLEALARLAGGVAHDFNNLLTIIMSGTQLAIGALPDDHVARRDLEATIDAAERATLITRRLLTIGRKQRVSPRVVDLGAYVEDARPILQRMVGEDVVISVDVAPPLGGVLIDPAQVEQILFNLAANARDAMPKGGRLTIHTSEILLDDTALPIHKGVPLGRHLLLSMTDTGDGIPDALKPHVFEPFFTTKAVDRGTGLGLATVHGIVVRAGGHISVQSDPGMGATFRIYLPLARLTEDDAATPAPLTHGAGGVETILLVEDEEGVRSVVQRTLERSGYAVLEAGNAGEALLLCEQHAGTIHLLLTDVVMPRMTGPQLVARLRPLRPSMRVVYISGYKEERLSDWGDDVTHDGFIAKPASVGALLDGVRAALDRQAGADDRPTRGASRA